MLNQIRMTLMAALLVAVCCDAAVAQRVFNSSRGRTTGTSNFNTGAGSRWGSPATSGFGSSSNRPNSSPEWNLRPTYNSSRSVTPRYDASSFARGRSLSYSSAPRSSRSYSVNPGQVHYYHGLNHAHLHPYDQARFINGLPLQYSHGGVFIGGGLFNPPTIIAPPIVLPFGGVNSSFLPPVNQLAPVPSTVQMPFVQNQQLPQPVPQFIPQPANNAGGQMFSQKIPADESPIVSEFGEPAVDTQMAVAAADRIRSLRYQTSGDSAFRKQDYSSAVVFYKTAAETAPSRRAPWIRLAWANVALQQYDDAVAGLKSALTVNEDPINSWIAGDDLYGNNFSTDGNRHSDQIWEWLQQRPNSTDRLMLVAGFQQMRGYSGIAGELLEAAAATGLEPSAVETMRDVFNSAPLRQPVDPVDQPAMRTPAPSTPTARATPRPDEPGIRMRGRELLSPSTDTAADLPQLELPPTIGEAQPLPSNTVLPEEVQQPQEAKNLPLVPEVSGVSPMPLRIPVSK